MLPWSWCSLYVEPFSFSAKCSFRKAVTLKRFSTLNEMEWVSRTKQAGPHQSYLMKCQLQSLLLCEAEYNDTLNEILNMKKCNNTVLPVFNSLQLLNRNIMQGDILMSCITSFNLPAVCLKLNCKVHQSICWVVFAEALSFCHYPLQKVILCFITWIK